MYISSWELQITKTALPSDVFHRFHKSSTVMCLSSLCRWLCLLVASLYFISSLINYKRENIKVYLNENKNISRSSHTLMKILSIDKIVFCISLLTEKNKIWSSVIGNFLITTGIFLVFYTHIILKCLSNLFNKISSNYTTTAAVKSMYLTLISYQWASLVAQLVKNLPAMQETLVWLLGQEYSLEKGEATHSSVLRVAWWLRR